MDKVERRQRAEEAHQEREREAQAAALRQIRDAPQRHTGGTPGGCQAAYGVAGTVFLYPVRKGERHG